MEMIRAVSTGGGGYSLIYLSIREWGREFRKISLECPLNHKGRKMLHHPLKG